MLRLPGLTTGIFPSLQIGQSSGSNASTSILITEENGTPKSALPPLLSTIEPTPTTTPPISVKSLITSLTEPPVVITSSTTKILCPSLISKPRLKAISPFSLSVKKFGTPRCLETS